MPQQIESLSDEQALQAVKLFFELSPPEIWANGNKPTADRIKQISDALVSHSSGDVKPIVASLVDDGDAATLPARAQVARLVLDQLSQTPAFEPTVNQAVETASQPHKFLIEPITGIFVLAILLATSKIETPGGLKISLAGNMSDILGKLPDVMKALPEGVWNVFTGGRKKEG